MSAKNVRTAVAGPILGGSIYILFAFVPMLIVVAAVLAMPEISGKLLAEDPQQLLPTLVRDYMPMLASSRVFWRRFVRSDVYRIRNDACAFNDFRRERTSSFCEAQS